MRDAFANVKLVPGSGRVREIHVPHVEEWQTEQSIDNDVDSFSVNLGDLGDYVMDANDRDTEVRCNLFYTDDAGRTQQVFAGIADTATLSTSFVETLAGRDVPSAVLADTDAAPGYWRNVQPREFLASRGKKLGLSDVSIAPMKQIGRLWSDASETEWAFWYRVARAGGMYMWSTSTGRLIVDGLAYSPNSFAYSFGHPKKGETSAGWLGVEDVQIESNKQQRLLKVVVFGEDKKKTGKIPEVVVFDPPGAVIDSWLRNPTAISTSSVASTQKQLLVEGRAQMFDSIVGAQEHTLTVRDTGAAIKQNTMARVNLPEYGLVGRFFIVGVTRVCDQSGLVQVVRLRERGYAVTDRVPTAPTLKAQPNLGQNRSAANIAQGLAQGDKKIRWYGSFVRAAKEFGVAEGWDLAGFLGVLLAISDHETGGTFGNIRQDTRVVTLNHRDWVPMPTSAAVAASPSSPFRVPSWLSGSEDDTAKPKSLAQLQQEWKQAFGNSANDLQYNPLSPDEAGAGPMQLTSVLYKDWADRFGFDGDPRVGEFDGGRWNPDSNIRAGAKALIAKTKAVSADPTNFATIWNAVAAYNGSGPAAKAYATKVKALYDSTYGPEAQQAVASASKTVVGSAQRAFTFNDDEGNPVNITLPDNAPSEVAKAITWALSQLGSKTNYSTTSRYQYGGSGNPGYDCSSFVVAAMTFASPTIRRELGSVTPGNHGPDTFGLRDSKYGVAIGKDDLLPGDLVFFDGQLQNGELEPWGHVGMYLGQGLFVQDPHTQDYVKVSGLNETYYRNYYLGARRFFDWPGVGGHG